MNRLWQDLRYGARMLIKQPGFTLIASLTLALGIGANTAIFSVINALILNPPRIAEADRVAAIWRTEKDKRSEGFVSYLDLQDWRAQSRSFEAIAGHKPNGFILLNGDQAERLQGMRVTANFLSLLKVQPLLGRDFRVEEEKRGAEGVVIISHQFWQNRLGGSDAALTARLDLNGKPFTIIGVLPPGFEFPLAPKQAELITTIAAEGGNLDERGAKVLRAVGRLRQDVTFTEAQAELTNVAANLERQYPQHNRNITAYLTPVDEQIVGVVGDVRHRNLTRPAAPELYLPYQQNSWSWGNFFVRTTNDPAALTRSFTEAIRSGDKTAPVIKVRPLAQAISDTVAQARFYTLLFALFGATGLLLTLTGIYGVISYTVSQRTQEIGVRMALGAQARDVLKLVVGQGLVMTLIGVGLGLLGSLGLTRLMQALLFSVSSTDPLVFAIIPAALIAVALVACYVPARRATKVDPLVALRCE